MLSNLKVIKLISLTFCLFIAELSLAEVRNEESAKIISPVDFFVDREKEVNLIKSNLRLHKITSIVGVTGIGKTEIARKYASLNKQFYKLIWFFDASLDLCDQFASLAKTLNNAFLLGEDTKISEDPKNAKLETMKYLSCRTDWLLIFDNLRLNHNDKIEEIIHWHNNGNIIICSQDSKGLPNIVYIHKLGKGDAIELLQKILGKEAKNEKLYTKLVNIFDGYPAPIVRGALLLKEHSYLSIKEYKSILAKSLDPIKRHMTLVLNLLNDKDKKLLNCITVLNNQHFSKNLLQIINGDEEVGENLYNLNRFGLIKNSDNNNQGKFFEMHDAVKEKILQLTTFEETRSMITNIIDKLNASMPHGVTSRYFFITSDPTFKSNLEILLENSEEYKVEISKVLELRKNLINYYMAILDHYNWEKMKNWLIQKETDNLLKMSQMNNHVKENYAWYLVDIGLYESFVKSSFTSALDYFNKAKDVAVDIPGQPELKSTILFQIAQVQAFGGDLLKAAENIAKVDNLLQDYRNGDFDMGLYWFIKAKLALAHGNYSEALTCINNNIKAEKHLPQGAFTAPTYILKAEILNFMGEYTDSYKIIKKIKEQEIPDNHPQHEIHARILTQLSAAELGLGLKEDALNNINIACDIFNREIEKYKIGTVLNTDLAAALVFKGNVLTAYDKFDEALLTYNEAEAIYLRRYGDNFYNMDNVNYLLFQGAKVACLVKNYFWSKHFYNQLVNNFDKNHVRLKEIEKIYRESNI